MAKVPGAGLTTIEHVGPIESIFVASFDETTLPAVERGGWEVSLGCMIQQELAILSRVSYSLLYVELVVVEIFT